MKKILCLTLCTLFFIGLVGCAMRDVIDDETNDFPDVNFEDYKPGDEINTNEEIGTDNEIETDEEIGTDEEINTSVETPRGSIKLSDEEHRKLNIFFSNFSEAYFADYDSNNYDLESLINFAYIHNKINNYKYIEVDGNDMYISADRVEKTISKYFGIKIDHQSAGDFIYRDGNYFTPGADGENYNYFSQVNTIEDNEDGTYSVEISIYMLEDVDDGVDSIYYEPKKVWDNTHPYQYIREAEALIKPAIVDGKSTYQLLKYKVIK